MRKPSLEGPLAVAPADAAGARRVERRSRRSRAPPWRRASRAGSRERGRAAFRPQSSARRPSPNRRIVSAAAKRRRRFDERIGKARMDEIVPAIGRAALRGLIAGDDEALSRAGHGDIEQAAMFARLSLARLGPRGGDRVGVLGRLPGPGQDRRIARPSATKAASAWVRAARRDRRMSRAERRSAPRVPCWRGRSRPARPRSRPPCRA